ncbi:hypothetical protein A9G45_06435 [Gilliamella sp. HK2]|jgi:hypothetical protein|uniref:hypothetical protein n=1 Tax=unclassified Gilliamella TaxID=2685620 RepID=UPI00080DB13E|nr:hypothetical protein [Gilliamella apicola]OCG27628.1 hypothetical protein A9G46_03115 [Gilliamella apicola]OCG28571.1 hypothetical protein A9G45_06435 [Gilliamella apicola]
MKKLIFIVASFFISPFVLAETQYPDAPLGLKWGMTVAELESKAGAVLEPTQIDENVSIYSLKSPPMALPKFTEYFVLVHKDLGAMKIIMNEKITSDIYGTKGKKEYFKYKEALTNKFGKPDKSLESVGLKLYKDSDEFYQCLKYEGCGYYASVFGDHLSLQLEGIERGKGNLSIVYESELFTKYKADKENENKNKIKNGL